MTSRHAQYDVVISGASFAGLALARGLSLELVGDCRIALVDRVDARRPIADDGRAFAIWAAARRALDVLGAWPQIAPFAQPMSSIEITDTPLDASVRPAAVTYDAVTPDAEPACHVVPSFALLRALVDLVAKDPAVTWIAPAEAISFNCADETAVVGFQGRDDLAASLVVAADGRNSRLREAAGIKTVGWGYPQAGIVTTVHFELPHNGIAIQHFLPGGPFAILPLKDNRACVTWSAATDDAARMQSLSDADFVQELDLRIGGRFGAITLAGPRQHWPLDLKIPRSLTAPRFALIGDAAHGVHPIAGQGVNLALRDVAALVECLGDATRLGFDLGHAPALERYSRWRRFDATMSASLYDGLNRVFSADSMMLRAGRSAALATLDRMPAIKSLIMAEASGLTGDLPRMMQR